MVSVRIFLLGFVLLIFSKSIYSQVVTGSVVDISQKNAADSVSAQRVRLFRKIFKDSIPRPAGYVNDYENLFTSEQENTLDSMIAAYEKETTIEIAIVSIDTVMTAKEDFESLTLKMLNTWGVGKKEKNNGVLIGICKGYRLLRIENGYGIEKVLSDDETKEIIETAFIPLYKEGKYYDGTLNGLKVLMNRLR